MSYKFFVKAAIVIVSMIFFIGCGRSQESLKREAVKFVNAKNYMEMVVGKNLTGMRYMPGLEESRRNAFMNFCMKINLPPNTPFEKLLKKGNYDHVDTNVIMQTLQEANNPFEKDLNIFKITFRAKKIKGKYELTNTMQFVVAFSPEGSAIMGSSCVLELNGREEEVQNNTMLFLISDAGKKGEFISHIMDLKIKEIEAAQSKAAKKKHSRE